MALQPPLADSVRMSEEVFQRPMLDPMELDVSTDSQEESPLPLVRRKRIIQRFTESSIDDGHVPKVARHDKLYVRYHESDSSSDGEGGHLRLPHALSSSKNEGNQKLKLVLELLSQSKAIESVLHVGCRIQSWEAVGTKSELPIGVLRGCPSCNTCQKVVATWRPEASRKPCIEEAPVFYPNEQEFQHPLKYIASIRARAESYGICRIVPPPSWKPPCPLQGDSADVQKMQFPTRVQQVHKLQVRLPTTKECFPTKQANKKRKGRGPTSRMGGSVAYTPSPLLNDQEYFGFWPGDPFPLGAFEKYANDFKDQYFRISERQRINPKHKWEPTIDMIEGEYWRIVEQATDQIEVLYGADVETGKFGSGFPKAEIGSGVASHYENSGWNLNNIARHPGSMLSFEEGDISGVLVPWLYIGMCFSSFCWHVEDHHFYSLNYMHWGAPKIWYGVPGYAADKLEAAMKKYLPDLFNEQPDLLHKLVTQLSPSFLKQEGVPVYRLVQQPGNFVITFPNAYHSGFNTGFNVAEAVNVAPVDWLPHGQAAVELYRKLHRKTSISHDKLLLKAARVAVRMWWHLQLNEILSQTERPSNLQPQSKDTIKDYTSGLEPSLVSSWQAYCGEGGVLAKALKERVDMEQAHQESLKSISDENLTMSMKQMDSSYDSTDERECELCKYDLHLSAIGCECCPDKFACLLHGHLLCTCPWSKKTLFYRYHLEQLILLLAAVEGRPGAIANWVKQDAQQPTSCQDILLSKPMVDKLPGSNNSKGLHPHTTFAIAESSTHIGYGASTVRRESLMTQSFQGPLIPIRNPVQVAASCNNNRNSSISQESSYESSYQQKVVFLKSGYARSIVKKDYPKYDASNGTSKKVSLITNSDNLIHQPACFPCEKLKQVDASKSEAIILLSDDEEETTTCELNEVRESSFTTHDVASSNHLKATENAIEIISERHPSHGYFGVVSGGGNKKQLASTMIDVRSHVKERAIQALSSTGMTLKLGIERPKECTIFARPSNDSLTVVQRSNYSPWILPRVARVHVKKEVDMIDVGCVVIREGWHSRHAIYPAGFKSQTRFINVEDVYKTCVYISEIIDQGLDTRPLFQVTHPTKQEVYLHDSIDGCWHEIQNQINEAIIACRSINNNLQLPSLLPPPSGLEMFGFTSTSIIEAVEALDPFHQCFNYWNSKQTLNQRPGLTEPEIQRAKTSVSQRTDLAGIDVRGAMINVGQLKEEDLEQPLRPLQDKASPNRIANTNSRPFVNIGRSKANGSQASLQEIHPARQGSLPNGMVSKERNQEAGSILQGLFQRAAPAELRVLNDIFTSGTQCTEWRTAFQALTEEVQRRFL